MSTQLICLQLPLAGSTNDESFIRALALDIQFVFFLSEDWICMESDLRHEIYYIREGAVRTAREHLSNIYIYVQANSKLS